MSASVTIPSPPDHPPSPPSVAPGPHALDGSVVHLLLGSEGGGIITAVAQWARLLERAGWPIHFVSLAESTATEMLRAEGYRPLVVTLGRAGRLMRLARNLAPLWPAIIHCHNPASHLMAMIAARRLGARVVRTVHADMFEEMRTSQPRWKIALWRLAMKRVLPRTALVTIVSPHLASLLPGLRGDEANLAYIPNGFDPAAIESDRTGLSPDLERWLGDAPMVLAMGRLVPVKNFSMLLRAWQRMQSGHPGARLVIAGSGAMEAALRRMVSDMGLGESVRFVGWVSRPAPLLRRCLAVAISSRSECCPMLVFEAMAACRPVVATRVGGIPHLIEDERDGLLVPDDDAGAMAGALSRLIADPQLAQRLGRLGRTTLESRHSAGAVAARMAASYASIALPQGARPAHRG